MSAQERHIVPTPLPYRKNMLWNSTGSLTYLVCQWLITVLVVRLSSGYDAAGLLSLAMSVTGIFGTLANYKMGTYQVSDVKREHDLSEYLGFRAFMLTVSFVACMIYAAITCVPAALATVALWYAYKAVGLLIDVLHGEDQLGGRMDYIGMSFILQGIVALAIFYGVFRATQSLNLAIAVMIAGALLVLFAFDVPRASRFAKVRFSLTKKKLVFFLTTPAAAAIAYVAVNTIFAIPKQYLSFAFGDAALGIYSSVAMPSLIIQMGALYIYSPLLSVFPRHFYDHDTKGLVKLLARTSLAIVAVGAACAIVLEFVGSWLLQLIFGASIAPYVYLLQPVILATVLTGFLWFIGDLLVTLRNFKAYFIGNLIALVAVIPLSFYCVDHWDMNGVSFAGIAACACGLAFLFIALFRTVRRGPKDDEQPEGDPSPAE